MTAAVMDRTPVRTHEVVPAYRQTFGRVVRAEWIKARTLRGTWLTCGLLVLVMVGVAALAGVVSTAAPGQESDPLATVLGGSDLAVMIAGVLGSIAGAREYGSRMVASTFAVTPRRWRVIVAKTTVFGGLLVAVSLVAVLGAFLVGTWVLSARGQGTAPFLDAHTIGYLLGMAGYLSAIGLIGLGVGILLRNVAGAVVLIVAGILVLPNLAEALLPDGWDALLRFLPSSAAAAFTAVHSATAELLPGPAAVVVLVAWVVVIIGASAVVVQRRDV